MGKLVPIVLAVIGIGGGIGAGLALRPAPEDHTEMANPCGDVTTHEAKAVLEPEEDEHTDQEYVKLNNQFVVPVVATSRVEALIVVSLSVEVSAGRKDEVYAREPKLRDAFLQVFFDHSNTGGFKGTFTNSNNMDVLRRALLETAGDISGDLITDVLIMDIARQDV
ncbi:flagellar basal body-associated FliL family protein [Lentibacter algarum]|uniref:flagellar basal body-associated FliL family protein n=1 Tax=Lentibacter algarum TaxID=576131 RepID=UPI001C06DE7A|nr:flagellar basal body-associated FliL family protein [Lentibacter algarum]MBU2981198.1 flagellar basal body-associated FliL family protein [Lentibacter algarum]